MNQQKKISFPKKKVVQKKTDPLQSKIKSNFDEPVEENLFVKKKSPQKEISQPPLQQNTTETNPKIETKSRVKFGEDEKEEENFSKKKTEGIIENNSLSKKNTAPEKDFPESSAFEKKNTLKTDIKENKEEEIIVKKPAKTMNSKMMDLQSKLGNLPMGRPDDRISMNPRKNQKREEKVELDHDLLLDKPTISRKKKPRGQKK